MDIDSILKIKGVNLMDKSDSVPIWHKYLLTIEEASKLFNIGEKKLRQIVAENREAEYILMVGTKCLIKKDMFSQVIDGLYSI